MFIISFLFLLSLSLLFMSLCFFSILVSCCPSLSLLHSLLALYYLFPSCFFRPLIFLDSLYSSRSFLPLSFLLLHFVCFPVFLPYFFNFFHSLSLFFSCTYYLCSVFRSTFIVLLLRRFYSSLSFFLNFCCFLLLLLFVIVTFPSLPIYLSNCFGLFVICFARLSC